MTSIERAVDVAVVGGGITGLAAALALSDQGARVALFDAARHAGSDANAGSLHVQLQSRLLRLFPEEAANVESSLPVYLAAVQAWKVLDRRLGGVELVQKGGLMLAEGPDQLAFLEKKAERELRLGLDVAILDRDELAHLAPWLGDHVIGAELCRDEGKLNPLVANRKLLMALKRAGVAYRRCTVERLEPDALGVRVVHGDGSCRAERVVLATSWGTRALGEALGTIIPVSWEPLHMNITEPADYVIEHLVQHAERPITLKQFQSGQIVIGGGWKARFDSAHGTPEVLEGSVLGNTALAAWLAPGIRNLRVIRTWAGLNTTADGKSIIGPLDAAPRVIVAVPGDAGYTLGPLVGKIVADLALEQAPAFDLAPFRPSRFV
ncbi:MAG: FAD-binding oxidoreductase [Alphaproteobacteria bacterium]|nr:FAD-binding oxidoreductase [Alphaproteobacteria bacterium]